MDNGGGGIVKNKRPKFQDAGYGQKQDARAADCGCIERNGTRLDVAM
jgi:hypothetical protein